MSTDFVEVRSDVPASSSSGAWKVVGWGCAIGCLGFLAVVVIGGVSAVRWAQKPTPLPEVNALVTPDVDAFGVLSIDPDSPSSGRFVDALVKGNDEGDRKIIRKALPASVAFVVVGSPPRVVGMVSLHRYMNWLRLPVLVASHAESDDEVVRFRGETIIVDSDADAPVSVAFVGGSLILGSDAGAVKFAIDRLKDKDGDRASPELAKLLTSAGDGPVRFAAVNDDGQLTMILEALEKWDVIDDVADDSPVRELLARSQGLVVNGALGEPEAALISGVGWIELADATERDAEIVNAALPALVDSLEESETKLAAKARLEQNRVVVDYQLAVDPDALQDHDFQVGPVKVDR